MNLVNVTASDHTTELQKAAKQVKALADNNASLKTEDAKKRYERKIIAKLKAGKPLTSKEITFLKLNNPELYKDYVRIEMKKKSVEIQLKGCKSKEEVQQIQASAIGGIGENDPLREMLTSAVNYVIEAFEKTSNYKNLPQTTEEAKQNKANQSKGNIDSKENSIAATGNDTADSACQNVEYQVSLGQYQQAYETGIHTQDSFNLLS